MSTLNDSLGWGLPVACPIPLEPESSAGAPCDSQNDGGSWDSSVLSRACADEGSAEKHLPPSDKGAMSVECPFADSSGFLGLRKTSPDQGPGPTYLSVGTR